MPSEVYWTSEATQAFNNVKTALANAALLSHPPSQARLSASHTNVRAMLHQHVFGRTEPLAFFLKSLQPWETCYSTFGRELLASYLPFKNFYCFLEGRDFCLYTDHKPHVVVAENASNCHFPREQQHLDYTLQFTSDIRCVKVEDNIVTNACRMFLHSQPMAPIFPSWSSAYLLTHSYTTGN